MNKVIRAIQSYYRALNITEVIQRLPAIVIALWLGVISIAMIPQLNIIEGGILFILFFSSCLLIDSVFNPKKIRNPKIAQAIHTIGLKNYTILIMIHLCLTIVVAIHLSYLIMKIQILALIIAGLSLNVVNSIYISRSKSLAQVPNVTGVIASVVLPMFAAFYVAGENFDLFSLAMISGIGFIYMGLEVFNQTKSDLEVAPESTKSNSVEWEALSVASELNLPNSRIKEIAVQLYNIRNENEFKKIPRDQCALFLPHCLRMARQCKATYTDEGLQCKHCSKECKVNLLTKEGTNLGYKCFVVPGGAMVFNIAKKYRPKGVVAVACLNELREGTGLTDSEYKVPFQIVQLRKDGCVNTDVCFEEVVDVLSSNRPDNKENN